MNLGKPAVFVSGLLLCTSIVAVGCGTSGQTGAAAANTPAANANGGFRSGPRGAGNPLTVVSKVLNVPLTTLRSELQGGKSILDIAKEQGMSESTLTSDLKNEYKSSLDALVSAGRISSDQEQQLIDRFDANLNNMITRKGLPARNFGNSANHP